MPGFAIILGSCYSCQSLFSFNPHKVPSIRVNDVRQPICGRCMEDANEQRADRGLPPHPIHPDAYEAIPEEELG